MASTLLCLNLGQIWLVRSPFSETLAQVLLLAGVWMLTLTMSRRRFGLGFLSGLVFGLSLMVRIDSVLAILAMSLFLILVRLGPKRWVGLPVRPVAAGLAIGLVCSLVHIAIFAYPYVLGILFNQGVLSFLERRWGCLVVLALMAVAVAWPSKRLIRFLRICWERWFPQSRLLEHPATRRWVAFVSLSGLVIVAFAYGYFLRPMMASGGDLLPLSPPIREPFPATMS